MRFDELFKNLGYLAATIGSQVRDYLFVDDFVEASIRLLEAAGSDLTVHVATGRGTRLDRLFEIVREVTGVPVAPVLRPAAYSGVSWNVLDIARLTALTGWKPRYPIGEGIAETWRRLRESRLDPVSA